MDQQGLALSRFKAIFTARLFRRLFKEMGARKDGRALPLNLSANRLRDENVALSIFPPFLTRCELRVAREEGRHCCTDSTAFAARHFYNCITVWSIIITSGLLIVMADFLKTYDLS